jgi:hypothetical protein
MDLNNMMQQMMMNAMNAGQQSSGGKKKSRFSTKGIVLVVILLLSLLLNFRQSRTIKKLLSTGTMETTTIHPYNRCLKIVMKSLSSDQIAKTNPDDIMKMCETLKTPITK